MSTMEHAADKSAAMPATPSTSDNIQLRTLGWSEPLQWLKRGVRDYTSHPAISLFYGICFMAMGWAVLKVYEHAPAYTLVMSAALLLTGPLLCMGLYQMSMRLEQGVQEPDFGDSLLAWDEHIAQLAIFGFVLLVLEMLWGRSAMIIFAVSFDGIPDLKGSLMALLDPENVGFIVTYLCVSTVFGLLIFSISAVSIPMMLDRQVDSITAGLTSMKLVLTQPGVMLFWGALIVVLMVAAMLPWFLGLLFVGPIVGHASWHAYRAAVAWKDAPVSQQPATPAA
ncbi:MAG: hypothetical protein RLY71_926 [Pseudomonadota bacterium]